MHCIAFWKMVNCKCDVWVMQKEKGEEGVMSFGIAVSRCDHAQVLLSHGQLVMGGRDPCLDTKEQNGKNADKIAVRPIFGFARRFEYV